MRDVTTVFDFDKIKIERIEESKDQVEYFLTLRLSEDTFVKTKVSLPLVKMMLTGEASHPIPRCKECGLPYKLKEEYFSKHTGASVTQYCPTEVRDSDVSDGWRYLEGHGHIETMHENYSIYKGVYLSGKNKCKEEEERVNNILDMGKLFEF